MKVDMVVTNLHWPIDGPIQVTFSPKVTSGTGTIISELRQGEKCPAMGEVYTLAPAADMFYFPDDELEEDE